MPAGIAHVSDHLRYTDPAEADELDLDVDALSRLISYSNDPFAVSHISTAIEPRFHDACAQPLVLDLHSMCTKYSPHRLHMPCTGHGGNGPVVEAADFLRSDVEAAGSANPKAHFHLYEVRASA